MPNPVQATEGAVAPNGYQQLTGTTLASLALTVPDGSLFALIVPTTNAIRYRDDGTAPTATVGYPVAVSQTIKYTGNLKALQMIPQSGTATIDVAYYKAIP